MKRIKPIILKSLIIIVASTLFLTAMTWIMGGILVSPHTMQVGDLPKDLTGENISFQSAPGTTIKGWLIPGKKDSGIIILMHGVRGSRLQMLERARFLNKAGYGVMLFDFQAHGESTGPYITFGYLESKDAQAAVAYLHQRFPQEKIGVIGTSMGGAAILLASPPLDVNVMVVESVYPAIDQAISDRITMKVGNWGSIITPLVTWQIKPRFGFGADALRPIDKVDKITVPKLFIAGTEDKHTTLAESMDLFNKAAEPKELWTINGAAHIDLHGFAKDEYEKHILDLFSKYLR